MEERREEFSLGLARNSASKSTHRQKEAEQEPWTFGLNLLTKVHIGPCGYKQMTHCSLATAKAASKDGC